MNKEELSNLFDPLLADIVNRATVTDQLISRDDYQVLITTVWANVVLNPEEIGIVEEDLETLHDLMNAEIAQRLGEQHNLTECFRFLTTKTGEAAMQAAKISSTHKDLLLYFSSMILDPEGHKKWMATVSPATD